jgi:3-carboxy-cis,cis-muconate cycloisomerase
MSLLDALFRDNALDKLFSDEARIQGMLDFEAALARAEANCGIVPPSQAQIIASKCRAEDFDFAGIAKDAALSGNLAIPLIRLRSASTRCVGSDRTGFGAPQRYVDCAR